MILMSMFFIHVTETFGEWFHDESTDKIRMAREEDIWFLPKSEKIKIHTWLLYSFGQTEGWFIIHLLLLGNKAAESSLLEPFSHSNNKCFTGQILWGGESLGCPVHRTCSIPSSNGKKIPEPSLCQCLEVNLGDSRSRSMLTFLF